MQPGFVSPTELDRARSELDTAKPSLKQAQTLRDLPALRAPADAVIIRRDRKAGQCLINGQALFYLSCGAPLRVSVKVDEEDTARMCVGQKMILRTDAFLGRMLDAKVLQITPKGTRLGAATLCGFAWPRRKRSKSARQRTPT